MSDKNDGVQPDSSPEESNSDPIQSESVPEQNQDHVAVSGDELPEEEELTPELIEEEAIRGDFMLRWAAIFLTILFAFGLIADTRVLVHVRSGEFLAANGFLPNQTDQLSYAAPESPLTNTSWLFDLLVAQAYAIGEDTGLTILQVVIAALIAWTLSRISVRMMPTWWNSVCCVLAAAAFSVDLLPITDMITILGLAMTLRWLHASTEGDVPGLIWKLPLLIVVWCNLDPRAYLGAFAVVLFALGTLLRGKSDGSTASDSKAPDGRLAHPGLLAVLSIVALFVNPFPIASGLAALTTYSVEYPNAAVMKVIKLDAPAILDGRSEYHGILSSEVWHSFEFAYVAGVCLLITALIVLALNRSRQDLPWVIVFIGFFLLTVIAVKELPAAALVAAVVAGTSAQRWYGRTFRQEYSIETAEVMFSRGGRAATVFAMALLGFCVVADRLPTRTAIGFGFDPQLKETISSLSAQLADVSKEDHLLNTKLEQGDALIWDGRQSFVDSRVRMLGRRQADGSVMNKFEQIRQSLLPPPTPPEPKPGEEPQEIPPNPFYNAEWKKLFDLYEIKQVMIRLSPPGMPAYGMVNRLDRAKEWVLVDRGAAAAMFRYSAIGNEEPEYSLRDIAFVKDETLTEEDLASVGRFEYAQPPTFYQNYLYLERPTASAALRDARHMMILDAAPEDYVLQVASQFAGNPERKDEIRFLGRSLAGPLVSIRRCNQTLLQNPNDSEAYQIQATAYRRLDRIEQAIAQVGGGQGLPNLRYFQAVIATHQALRTSPDAALALVDLANLFEQRNRIDLALKYLQEFLELKGDELIASEGNEQFLEDLYEREAALIKMSEEMNDALAEAQAREFSEDPQQLAMEHFEIVNALNNQGFVLKALEYFNEKEALLQPIAAARVMKGQLLMEAGELEEGFKLLNGAAEVAQDPQYAAEYLGVRWQLPVAVSHIGKGAYSDANNALQMQLAALGDPDDAPPEIVKAVMRTLPLIPAVETTLASQISVWPSIHLQSNQVPMSALPSARALPLMQMAMLNLEAGRIGDAKQQLEQLITDSGDSVYRPLAAVYLAQFGEDATEKLMDSYMYPYVDFEFPSGDEENSESSEEDAELKSEASEGDKSGSAEDPASGNNTDSTGEKSASTDAASKETPGAQADGNDKPEGESPEKEGATDSDQKQ